MQTFYLCENVKFGQSTQESKILFVALLVYSSITQQETSAVVEMAGRCKNNI